MNKNKQYVSEPKEPLDPKDNPQKDPNPADQTPENEKNPKKYCLFSI